MKMETTDTNSVPKMVNIISINPEDQKEINKSVIKIICEILFEKGEISYDEKRTLIRKVEKRI